MARTNRISVPDAYYNITTRCANRAFLLDSPKFRDRIVDWIYGIADFCGVEVLSWTIMSNHLHLFVHVPTVPRGHWTSPDVPATHHLTQRPRPVRAPRFQLDIASPVQPITPNGDRPSEEAIRTSISEGVPLTNEPEVPTGFALSDDAMAERLKALYSGYSSGWYKIIMKWNLLRSQGRGDEVDAEKESLARRMYNVSQYMKILKQRISEVCNRETGHTGGCWERRFSSALVDPNESAFALLAGYFAWNPVKAGIVANPGDWKWSSYAIALKGNSPHSKRARKAYATMFGDWESAKARLCGVFAAKLPVEYDTKKDLFGYRAIDADGVERYHRIDIELLAKMKVPQLENAGYISPRQEFRASSLSSLPAKFPAKGTRSIDFFAKFVWRKSSAA